MELSNHPSWIILSIPLLALGTMACGGTKGDDDTIEDAGPDSGDAGQELYDVRILWRIGAGTRPCDDFGVQNIRLTLYDVSGNELERDTPSCNLGEKTFKRLLPGYYTVLVEGMDEEGFVTYVGENDQIAVPDEDHYIVDLSIIYGEAEVLWRFDSGYQCNAVGVETVRIVFEDENLSTPVNESVACSDGVAHLGQIPPGPYRVDVAGLNAVDDIIYSGKLLDQEVRPGNRVTRMEVVLEQEDK